MAELQLAARQVTQARGGGGGEGGQGTTNHRSFITF